MKNMLKGAALGPALAGLVTLGASAAPAMAADWNGGDGGLKDMRGSAAVPVPAPMPIPVYQPNWYFRFDGGLGLGGSGGGGGESGLTYGRYDSPGATGPEPFGTRSSWFNSDFGTFATYGAGVGFIWSDRFRTDLTVEAVSMGTAKIDGVERYDAYAYDYSVAPPTYGRVEDAAGNPVQQVNVYVNDETKVSTVVSLFNGYYDFGKLHGVTPYVGAGLGLAMHHMNRRHTTTETTCDPSGLPPCGTETTRANYSASAKQTGFSLAAALTAGVSYQVSDITVLDFNYRYLHVGGSDVKMDITDNFGNVSHSKVTAGDISEHQLRAGLRFNIH